MFSLDLLHLCLEETGLVCNLLRKFCCYYGRDSLFDGLQVSGVSRFD